MYIKDGGVTSFLLDCWLDGYTLKDKWPDFFAKCCDPLRLVANFLQYDPVMNPLDLLPLQESLLNVLSQGTDAKSWRWSHKGFLLNPSTPFSMTAGLFGPMVKYYRITPVLSK